MGNLIIGAIIGVVGTLIIGWLYGRRGHIQRYNSETQRRPGKSRRWLGCVGIIAVIIFVIYIISRLM
jgi:hypothetical protein